MSSQELLHLETGSEVMIVRPQKIGGLKKPPKKTGLGS